MCDGFSQNYHFSNNKTQQQTLETEIYAEKVYF